MKNSLWIVSITVIAVIGFLLGYSIPSFRAGGSAAVEVKKAEPAVRMDKAAADYYKSLQQDEN